MTRSNDARINAHRHSVANRKKREAAARRKLLKKLAPDVRSFAVKEFAKLGLFQ